MNTAPLVQNGMAADTWLPDRHLGVLLAGAGASLLPHLGHLPPVLAASAGAMVLWRALIQWRPHLTPPRLLLTMLMAVGLAGVVFSHQTLLNRDAGISVLAVFLGLKLLETRDLRDAQVVTYLCFFLVLTAFMFDQSPLVAGLSILALWLLLGALIGFHAEARAIGGTLRDAAIMLVQAAPVMVILFVLFPRVSTPLWGLGTTTGHGVTGLSDTMRPGSIGELSLSDAIVLRARFTGAVPPRASLYWRGPVMEQFDGTAWSADDSSLLEPGDVRVRSDERSFDYEVTLEPHDQTWMFALELPKAAPADTRYRPDFRLAAREPITRRIRYRVSSSLHHEALQNAPPRTLRRLTRLPGGSNPRIAALARTWNAEGISGQAFVSRAIEFFARQGLVYTLAPPLATTADTADAFLFDSRAGFCEHFASAFTILMRAGGIPARVVTGYQGGEINPVDNYLEVRQDDAHAWSEVLLEGAWQRVDPTAIAQPLRIEQGMARAVPVGDPVPLLGQPAFAHLARWRHRWDALGNGWNQYVLGFDRTRQGDLMEALGLDGIDHATRGLLMMGSIGVALALSVLPLALPMLLPLLRLRARSDPAQRLWRRFCARMARAGLNRAPSEGAEAFTARIARTRPDLASEVTRVGQVYNELRYGAAPVNPERLRELRLCIARVRP